VQFAVVRGDCRSLNEENKQQRCKESFGWTDLGPKDYLDIPTAHIVLNAGQHLECAESLDDFKKELFDTLLHEMIHGKFSLHIETGTSKAN
jgi:hypothetical protein